MVEFPHKKKEASFMKYVKQVLIILAFTGLGEVLAAIIPFPIPAAIYGIVLLLIFLGTGILKTEHLKETSGFLISIMPVLYVPACVRILEYWGIISSGLVAILTITVISTFLVFAVSGLVAQKLLKGKEKTNHG